ncbi:MAG: PEP-CTERM sorting domain-containing protein [Planctomycetes bacterium]|nr:PEP-CTERM sorting domain-containing protein [Planctomycetota bacterium]
MLICASTAEGYGQPYSVEGNWWHPGYKDDTQGLPEDGIITGASMTYHIASHTGNATYVGDWTEVASPVAGPPESIPNMAVRNNAMYVYSVHSTATGQVASTTAMLPVAQQGQYSSINLVLAAADGADGARNMRIVALYGDATEEVLYSFSTENLVVGPLIDDSSADNYTDDFVAVHQFSQMYNNSSGNSGSVGNDAGTLFEFADALALDPTRTLVGIRVEDSNPALNWNARGIVVFGASAEAVPEPATMALLGLGVLGLILRRRR